MKWLDRLLGRVQRENHREIKQLHVKWDRTRNRTERLERELRRVNAELRRQLR